MQLFRLRAFALLPLFTISLCAQIQFTTLQPLRGSSGTVVTLNGTGFDPSRPATVTLDGLAAPLVSQTASAIQFKVPDNARSGLVAVTVNGQTFTHSTPFRVLRSVPGKLQLPTGLSPVGYDIAAAGQFITPAADGSFTALVPIDAPIVVWAFREENDSIFQAVVTPTAAFITIDARSTAIAMVFGSPRIARRDPARADLILGKIAALPELQTLATLVQSISPTADYLNDGQVEAAWLQAVQKAAATIQRVALNEFKPNTPKSTFLKDLSPDYSSAIPATPIRLESSIIDVNTNTPADYRLKLDASGSNPLDWFVEVFELAPNQFAKGRASVDELTPSDTPRVSETEPLARGFVHASLDSAKLDLVDQAASYLSKWLFGSLDPDFAPNEFLLDKDVPGVYVSQAYSGNLWYGTEFFLTAHSQSSLLDRLNASPQWKSALAANMIVAAVDFLSVLVDVGDFVGGPDVVGKVVSSVFVDVLKTIQIQPKLDRDGVYDIFRTSVNGVFKGLISAGLEGGAKAVTKRFLKGVAKTVAKTIDILGKVSNVEQSLERTAGFLLPNALAIERSVVVIGNPWEPVITRFSPLIGRGNDIVTIEGFNFPDDSSDMTVSFCTFASTADPNSATTKLPVTILESTPTSIAFAVPTNFAALFPNRRANICIETTNGVNYSTAALQPPLQEFQFIEKPKIFSVSPDPVFSRGTILVTGTNFAGEATLNNEIWIDGLRSFSTGVQNGGDSTIIVNLPELAEGPHTIAVNLLGEKSDPFPFTVKKSASDKAGYKTGLGIVVTKLDLSNTPDGEISLLEACLIANGTLGRPIEVHDPCESLPEDNPSHCPPRPREIDHISGSNDGSGGGPLSRDTIAISSSLVKSNVVVSAVLPKPTSGDTYNFNNLTIDGGGSAGDAWSLEGVEGVTLTAGTFRNFGGNGLHFSKGATGNRVERTRFENCGGDGVFFDNDAQNNFLQDVKVSKAGKNGLHLSGANVRFNTVLLSGIGTSEILGLYEQCPGYGILLENGVQYNEVDPGTVRNNGRDGILVTGSSTSWNTIGRNADVIPRFYDVYNNGGSGLRLAAGVQHTVVHYVNPAGNQGDGVLLEGPDCSFNQVESIYTSYDFFSANPAPLPNQGSGIHLRNGAHHNLIGSRVPGSGLGRSAIIGNRDDGVLLEGPDTAFNAICRMHVGSAEMLGGFRIPWIPNGQNGIHIRGGSHDNTIGALHSFLDCHIMASKDAGILIEGVGSDNNVIFGNQIGGNHESILVDAAGQNRIGIYLKDGTRGNVIGHPGNFLEFFQQFNEQVFRFANVIANSTEAGIRIENCGGTRDALGKMVAANVIQNNHIGREDFGRPGPNGVGVLLEQDSYLNLIGGTKPGEGNRILHNHKAGLEIRNSLFDSSFSNEIINNDIALNGNTDPDPVNSPLQQAPAGVGILVDGNSTENVIGGSKTVANRVHDNKVGIYIDSSDNNTIQGMLVESNRFAGLILHAGRANLIGSTVARGANQFYQNGSGQLEQGAILLSSASKNRIELNMIGRKGRGNQGVGILLANSDSNFIGGETQGSANQILDNAADGIQLSGFGTTHNHIRNNLIGIDANQNPAGNQGDGIRLENGASSNLIGGLGDFHQQNSVVPFPMPNSIANNKGDGVSVTGFATLGNSILNNSITANGALGIHNATGGNQELPPPVSVDFNGDTLFGKVTDLNRVPVGSTIQVFSDPGAVNPEGALFLGEATVLTGGTWSIDLFGFPLGVITMTSTHAVDGSTSEFGTGAALDFGLKIERSDTATAEAAGPGATKMPVLKLTLTAVNADIRVNRLAIDASGTMDDASHVAAAYLYLDNNADGRITDADTLLAGPAGFVLDNGQVVFTNFSVTLPANTQQKWLMAYTLASSAPAGANFQAAVKTQASVNALLALSGAAITPGPTFPITSALFTVGASVRTSYADWKKKMFSATQQNDPSVSGPTADPDGDGVPNILEYAFNLDPLIPDERDDAAKGSGVPQPSRGTYFDDFTQSNADFLVVRYVRRKDAADLIYLPELTLDLSVWRSDYVVEDKRAPVGDGTYEIVTLRSLSPMTGPFAEKEQFIRIRVQAGP